MIVGAWFASFDFIVRSAVQDIRGMLILACRTCRHVYVGSLICISPATCGEWTEFRGKWLLALADFHRGRRERGTAQCSGATSRRVVGILPPQSGLVVVAPDGH